MYKMILKDDLTDSALFSSLQYAAEAAAKTPNQQPQDENTHNVHKNTNNTKKKKKFHGRKKNN